MSNNKKKKKNSKEFEDMTQEEKRKHLKEIFGRIDRNKTFTPEFFKKMQELVKKENEEWEAKCKRMNLNPATGEQYISQEFLNKRFTI